MCNRLARARADRHDEFYTQIDVIQAEINAYIEFNRDVFRGKTILLPCEDPEWSNFTKFFALNFETYGIKKLISTSYAFESKRLEESYQPTPFERNSKQFDPDKTQSHGKVFTLSRDNDNSGRIDINDLEWEYLEEDGDFRSDEVTALRDEADIIITNPPGSLFRDFLEWVTEADKKFLILGDLNEVACISVFPLVKENRIWFGCSIQSGDREFQIPNSYPLEAATCRVDSEGRKFIRKKSMRWFTNLDHGIRHEFMTLMTKENNIRFSDHAEIKDIGYLKYNDYDAIEVPYSNAIPSDYDGVMGVPLTFLDQYNPDQFEILECHEPCIDVERARQVPGFKEYKSRQKMYNGVLCQKKYHRFFIKRKKIKG